MPIPQNYLTNPAYTSAYVHPPPTSSMAGPSAAVLAGHGITPTGGVLATPTYGGSGAPVGPTSSFTSAYGAPAASGSALGPGTYPSLTSGPTQPGQGAYGTVPTVPNPIATAGGAITGNIGNLGGLYGLASGVGGASAAGQQAQYNANLPGYGAMTATGSANILSDLHGQVSPDVINLLGQQAAERGVGFGAGSPNSNAALLRSLGLTSMGLQAQGQQELTSAIGRTPVGPAFNPSSMLVTPGDVQGAATHANVLGSAPNPSDAAAAAAHAAGGGPPGHPGLTYGGSSGIPPLAPGTTGGWSPGAAAPALGPFSNYDPSGAYGRWASSTSFGPTSGGGLGPGGGWTNLDQWGTPGGGATSDQPTDWSNMDQWGSDLGPVGGPGGLPAPAGAIDWANPGPDPFGLGSAGMDLGSLLSDSSGGDGP